MFFLEKYPMLFAPDAGGSPAPASDGAPADTVSTAETSETGNDAVQSTEANDPFGGLDSDDGDDDTLVVTPKEKQAEPAAPAAPKNETTPKEQPAETAPTAPKETVSPQPETTPSAKPETNIAPSWSNPEQLMTAMLQNEPQLVEALAARDYAISDEEFEGLETDIRGSLPKLLGKVAFKTQMSMMQQAMQLVPVMVNRALAQRETSTKNQNSFYDAFPDLKAHSAEVDTAVSRYRALYPEATMKDLIENVGPLVAQKHGVKRAAAPTGSQPLTPQKTKAQPAPFQPAKSGGAPILPQSDNSDPFEGLLRDDYDDES